MNYAQKHNSKHTITCNNVWPHRRKGHSSLTQQLAAARLQRRGSLHPETSQPERPLMHSLKKITKKLVMTRQVYIYISLLSYCLEYSNKFKTACFDVNITYIYFSTFLLFKIQYLSKQIPRFKNKKQTQFNIFTQNVM